MAETPAKSEEILAEIQEVSLDQKEGKQLESFEGPEKLLEVWFLDPKEIESSTDADGDQKVNGDKQNGDKQINGDKKEEKLDGKFLRSVERKKWEDALNLVRCKILNVVQNDHFDSYLLSESSLFVWPKKVILKTCGTTTLLLALSSILDMARSVGLTLIGEVFYSRRNYFKPLAQLPPHATFEDEVKFLEEIFTGSSYVLGKKKW
jgi:S-adenosylmethionine decarboxylase